MARKRAKRRKPATIRKSQIVVDPDLRIPAQAVLTTTRRIKQTIADEADPAERRRLRGLLNRTYRKVRAYREALEELALEAPERAGPAIDEQIQIFLLLEDEFTAEARSRHN